MEHYGFSFPKWAQFSSQGDFRNPSSPIRIPKKPSWRPSQLPPLAAGSLSTSQGNPTPREDKVRRAHSLLLRDRAIRCSSFAELEPSIPLRSWLVFFFSSCGFRRVSGGGRRGKAGRGKASQAQIPTILTARLHTGPEGRMLDHSSQIQRPIRTRREEHSRVALVRARTLV